jgi:hypothetical protein
MILLWIQSFFSAGDSAVDTIPFFCKGFCYGYNSLYLRVILFSAVDLHCHHAVEFPLHLATLQRKSLRKVAKIIVFAKDFAKIFGFAKV